MNDIYGIGLKKKTCGVGFPMYKASYSQYFYAYQLQYVKGCVSRPLFP